MFDSLRNISEGVEKDCDVRFIARKSEIQDDVPIRGIKREKLDFLEVHTQRII